MNNHSNEIPTKLSQKCWLNPHYRSIVRIITSISSQVLLTPEVAARIDEEVLIAADTDAQAMAPPPQAGGQRPWQKMVVEPREKYGKAMENRDVIWSCLWFGTFGLLFHNIWECHHPNWRTHIFQRGRYTTNQWCKSTFWLVNWLCWFNIHYYRLYVLWKRDLSGLNGTNKWCFWRENPPSIMGVWADMMRYTTSNDMCICQEMRCTVPPNGSVNTVQW